MVGQESTTTAAGLVACVVVEVGRWSPHFRAEVRHLELPAHAEVLDILLQQREMVHQSRVELTALVEHALHIKLGHQRHFDLLEELLSRRVHGNGLLQLLELGEVSRDALISGLDALLVLTDFLEELVEGISLVSEHLVLGLDSLVNFHQVLDDVEVGQLLHSLAEHLTLLRLALVDGVEGLLDCDGARLLG